MNDNFAALDTRVTAIEGAPVPPTVVVAAATNSGNVAPNTGASLGFQNIPGLTATINVTKNSTLQVVASGVQSTTDESQSTVCHTGYRVLLDGVGKGDVTWGQLVQVSAGASAWHQGWTLTDSVPLTPGTHTVQIQAKPGDTNAPGSCYICADGNGTPKLYDACTLNVIATST
jgi:hypothetical protein